MLLIFKKLLKELKKRKIKFEHKLHNQIFFWKFTNWVICEQLNFFYLNESRTVNIRLMNVHETLWMKWIFTNIDEGLSERSVWDVTRFQKLTLFLIKSKCAMSTLKEHAVKKNIPPVTYRFYFHLCLTFLTVTDRYRFSSDPRVYHRFFP